MDYDQNLTIQLTKGQFYPSPSIHYHINYNFQFQIQHSGSLPEPMEETITDSARVNFRFAPTIPVKKSVRFFRKDTCDAIHAVLTCLPFPVSAHGRRKVVRFAIAEAATAVSENLEYRFKAVDLHFLVRIENRFILEPDRGGSCMVPASDSSVRLLLKNFDCTDDLCCICHEGMWAPRESCLMSMPCRHVFHDDCIKEWLRSSHYCPLCRFEMPTDK